MTPLARSLALSLVLLAVVLPACSQDDDDDRGADETTEPDDDSQNPVLSGDAPWAEVFLPEYPFWPNEAFFVDEPLVEDVAAIACARRDGEISQEDFFFGALAMDAFEKFFSPGTESEDIQGLLGNDYVSGYFGGLWLRDLLSQPARNQVLTAGFEGLRGVFAGITMLAAGREDVARSGSDGDVMDLARADLALFLYIYAYNLGYLQLLLENPPEGPPDEDSLVCGDRTMLDCRGADAPYAFLGRNELVLDLLLDPPGERWRAVAGLTHSAESSVEDGRAVWSEIDISGLDKASHKSLVDLSIGFLLVSKVVILGQMRAWAGQDPAEGRRALFADAGLVVWAGSYFLGLASPSPPGTHPFLVCR